MIELEQARHRLEELGMWQAAQLLEAILEAASRSQNTYLSFLNELLEAELQERQRRNVEVRMKLSHLPYRRTFAIKGLYKSKYQHNECNGFCMFSSTLSNDYFCSLHKVAIDLNLPIYKVKSFDCFIEPLEIMRLDNNNMFIAVISQRNVKIGSWGNALPCVDNPISGSPLIIDSLKDVIITIFGADFYKKLRQIIYQRKGKVISMEMTDGGWGYLYSKSSIEAKKEIENYANKYITPLFKQFPELYNNIYLALRKEGFLPMLSLFCILLF